MKKYININRNTYDLLAEEYLFRKNSTSEFEESVESLGGSVLYELQNYSKRKSGMLLEIGPGAGQLLHFFENNNFRTIGVELSIKMAEIAMSTSPYSLIINEDILKCKFMDRQFDIIYMGAIIHLFPFDHAMHLMRMVNGWLKDDGVIFVNTTCNEKTTEGYYKKEDYNGEKTTRYRKHWTEKEFVEFVLDCDFSVIRKMYTDEKDRGKMWIALICRKKLKEND